MEEITDPKIIEEFKKKQAQSSGIEGLSLGNEITDPKIIEQFNKQKNQQTIEGRVKRSLGVVKDFFYWC